MGYNGFDRGCRRIGATSLMTITRSSIGKQVSNPPSKSRKGAKMTSMSRVKLGAGTCPVKKKSQPVARMKKGGKVKSGGKICPERKAWAKRTFDTYPSAYANLAASKYCKDPNYAKKSKGGKRRGK